MPPDLTPSAFGYTQVDGIGRAKQRNIQPNITTHFFADTIGPIAEYSNLVESGGLETLRSATWFGQGPRQILIDAWMGTKNHWMQQDSRCSIIRGDALIFEDTLNSFKIDAHRAALSAGFGSSAALLVSAMGELIGNVEEHSEAAHTGLAAFLSDQNSFEFVVTDSGIGGLASLKKCVQYASLDDEGTALSKLIENGVSRFGHNKGRGNGFRPIFEKLAEMTGQLRFRSGGYALTLDGRFGDTIERKISQKPRLAGFLTSVVCYAPRKRQAPDDNQTKNRIPIQC